MAKRIYSTVDPQLFQHRPNGNYYCYLGSDEVCLETNDFEQARANRDYHKALVSLYGPNSFKKRVGELFPIYLKHLKEKKKRRATYLKRVEGYWDNYLKDYWEKKRLIDIHQNTWDVFVEKIQKTTGINDFRNLRVTLTGFMTWANRKRFLLAIPKLEIPEHRRRKRKVITPEHLRLIFQYTPSVEDWRQSIRHRIKKTNRPPKPRKTVGKQVPGGLRLFLALYLFEGTRRSENIGLEWDRVDLEGRRIVLRASDVKTGSKTGIGREIPMNVLVYALLVERKALLTELGILTRYVFPNARDPRRPMSESGFKTTWAKVLEAARLQDEGYTWHDFRATFKTHMNRTEGFTDAQREKMAGSSMDVQKGVYVTFTADDLRGLENVVQVPGLSELLLEKSQGLNSSTGTKLEKKGT